MSKELQYYAGKSYSVSYCSTLFDFLLSSRVSFHLQTVKTSQELRKPVYNGVAAKSIAFERVCQAY